MTTNPSDVSATQPGPDEYVTGPAYALVLKDGGPHGLPVVKVGYDDGELATWYQVALAGGSLIGYEPVPDISVRDNFRVYETGGVLFVPPGATVSPGARLIRSSTP